MATPESLRYDVRRSTMDAMIREVPSLVPHPDGSERIRQISHGYGRTQAAATAAFTRLNDFLIHGKIPAHLRATPQASPDKSKGTHT